MPSPAHIRRPRAPHAIGLLGLAVIAGVALGATGVAPAAAAPAAAGGPVDDRIFVEGEVLVTLRGQGERVLELPEGVDVDGAVRALRANDRVESAAPNYIARASFIPNDPGRRGSPGEWQRDQWNFLGRPAGVRASEAWKELRATGHPGGARSRGRLGVKVAVVDTGVAYRKKGRRYRRSPDLARRIFVRGRDFVGDDRVPLDQSGHGTHVASTIAESVNNRKAVTGLAYRARIMPVRVLNRHGSGTARDVARGIRWAARHGARVINLSLEFLPGVDRCRKIPGVCKAIRLANRKGAIVIAAAGNESRSEVAYPARVAVAVGGTTARGCLARYSSHGTGLDLVAPGGGFDVDQAKGGPNCDPTRAGKPIVQLTLRPGRHSFKRFGYPLIYEGTSMAVPHVSAVAALVLGSRILHEQLGRRPRPAELEAHLEKTACSAECKMARTKLYGAGLIDAAAAVGAPDPDPLDPAALGG